MTAPAATTVGDGRWATGAALASTAVVVARRFAAGSTMWSVAPEWPAHARHVAVEFVHPVIVGKRALPAVDVTGPDAAATLRLLGRPGDVLVAVGTATDPTVADLVRRAPAWGLTPVWLCAGPRQPDAGEAHVVWLEVPDDAAAARNGDLVVLYHLLWELTHVVFEHPGLLDDRGGCDDGGCTVCADEAVVGEIRSVAPDAALAVVGGRRQRIDVSLVEPVAPGDLVLVHAGVALSVVGEEVPL